MITEMGLETNSGLCRTTGPFCTLIKDCFADSSEIARWDEFVLEHGGHVFQTYDWGQVARRLGWVPQYLIWEDPSGQRHAQALILVRSRLKGALAMCYVPRGPVLLTADTAVWKAVATGLTGFSRDRHVILMRMNPLHLRSERLEGILADCEWEKAKTREMHVRTFRLALPENEENLWNGFEYRTQKAARKAERAGVKVTKEMGADSWNEFYWLYALTARRLRITYHKAPFIQAVWERFGMKGRAHLFMVRINGVAVAGIFLFQYGDTVEEMWIGWDESAREHRPNQYLHWQVLRWCIQNGIQTYDFGGVPPDAGQDHGIFFYKSGFGARLVDLIGEYDYFPSAWGRVVWQNIRPSVNSVWRRCARD